VSLPPQPPSDQPSIPDWPPPLAALIAELDSPRAKSLTAAKTGQQYDLVVQQLPTSTAPAREFGLPGMTPLAVNLLRRVGQPGVIFELVYSDPVADGNDEQILTYRAVDARGLPIEMQVWRMRAYCRGGAVYGQVRWHVLAGMWQALEWDGPWPPAAAFKQAMAALREMLDLRKRLVSHAGGRHKEPRDEARTRLLDAGRRALARYTIYPEHLTRPLIAAELNREGKPGKPPRADDVWKRAAWRLPQLKRMLDNEQAAKVD
jgi:hypothetical protein